MVTSILAGIIYLVAEGSVAQVIHSHLDTDTTLAGITYLVTEGSVAQVHTHLDTNAEKPGDEIITLENPLLLQLQGGEEGYAHTDRGLYTHTLAT